MVIISANLMRHLGLCLSRNEALAPRLLLLSQTLAPLGRTLNRRSRPQEQVFQRQIMSERIGWHLANFNSLKQCLRSMIFSLVRKTIQFSESLHFAIV